jgi:hypothetical protein
MIYVYAIVDRPDLPVPVVNGLEDVPIGLLSHRDIAAVTSLLSTGEVSTTEANLWRHEAVMDALMAGRALLPVRFGTVLADGVENVLGAHYDSFVARLDRVRGHVELALRVFWGDPGTADTQEAHGSTARGISSGQDYVAARLSEYREREKNRTRAEECVGTIHSALSGMAARGTHRCLPSPRVLMTASYLVKSGEVTSFQRELEDLRVSHPTLRLVCTGPWPPFTFCAEEECDNDNHNPWSDALALGSGRTR